MSGSGDGKSNLPERDPETLELFVEESLEALTRVEKLLLAAEGGQAPTNLMASLFRDIHTIKGTSGFLALTRILSLSHVAEDLLSRLRDEELEPRPAHFSLLMSVSDVLRRMIERVKATGDEGDEDVEPLVEKLKATLKEGGAAIAPGGVGGTPAFQEGEFEAPQVPKLGEVLATRHGVTPEQLESALAAQRELQAAVPKLGELLVAQHVVTPAQLDQALEQQQSARQEAERAKAESSDGTVRVNVAVLDRLMNLIGELVLARNQMVQIVRAVRDTNSHAQAACHRLSLVTSDLQEQVMKTRMQPVARVFERIPRMVRDLCQQTGKQVTTQVEGTATEIDKALVEAIRDPVMHIVRNAIDHGIEVPERRLAAGKAPGGRLCVRASHEGGMVTIEVEDDGRGMDAKALRAHAVRKGLLRAAEADQLSEREALELIFRPGFSTAEKVTDISGRGVGMDVVRTHVERAGGQVELESVLGKGSVIRLKMPLTLAIIPALLVKTGGQRFAIPQVNLLELVYLNEEQARARIETVRGAPIYRLRGEILPLVDLSEVLRLGPGGLRAAVGGVNVVVVAVGSRRYGLVVSEIHDTEEIVIKPLHGQLKRLTCYSGATVLGDGGVALILEVAGIAGMAGIDLSTQKRAATAAQANAKRQAAARQPYIVFSAGEGTPCAVPLAMVARLEHLPASSFERVGGSEVVQYRQTIMPIMRPEALLPIGQSIEPAGPEQPLIVFDFGQMVGMAVNRIVDIVELELDDEVGRDATPFTLGRVVVFGRTTLLLDVFRLARELVPTFVEERRGNSAARPQRILVVDDSNAMRAALTGYLRATGLEVVDVGSGEAALKALRAQQDHRFDAVVTDLEMPGVDGYTVLASAHKEHPTLPVFVWTRHDDPAMERRVMSAGARACVHKLRREELLEAFEAHGITAPRKRASDLGRF
ncbi:MAG: chemotaxis protein CheW [Deltaproteobacteria bacterium]|nr:chemotaxis protein CheW [Deltaproteobacteria bacterium]